MIPMSVSRFLGSDWNARSAGVLRFISSARTRQRNLGPCLAAILVVSSFLAAYAADSPAWLIQTRAKYTLYYAAVDRAQLAGYESYFTKGIAANEDFFQSAYPKRFDVYIHPDRPSFDTALQKVFHAPAFRSECWLAGVGEADAM